MKRIRKELRAEQGKQTLRLDKVSQVLSLFGTEVGVVPISKFNKL